MFGHRELFLGMLLLVISNGANALTISTGKDLQIACNAVERFSECVSYLEMIHKTIKAVGRMNGPQVKGLVGSCGPEQGIDTVPLAIAHRLAWQEYAKTHPERLHRRAIEEVLLAFEERWPCNK